MDDRNDPVLDASAFPVVVSDNSRLGEPGQSRAWLAAMDAVLARDMPFVLINLGASGTNDPEDKKAAALWFKTRREALSRLCRGMVMIEPDRSRWPEMRPMLEQQSRAFGMPMPLADDLPSAQAAAQSLMS